MKKISFLLFVFIISQSFSQGKIDGFYKGKGNASIVLGGGYEDSKYYFAGYDKVELSRETYYASFFASYGITDDFDFNISLPYIVSDKNKDFQDISLFLKYRVFKTQINQRNFEISIATGFSTPVSKYKIGGLNDIGQQATVFETRGMLHYKWNKGWFANAQSGFSYKLEEVPNSFPLIFKVGKANPKWYYDVYYDYQHSFGGNDYLGTPRPQNFRGFGVNYQKIGGTVFGSVINDLGAYISLSYVLSGRNIFIGPAYGIGLVYDFD